MAKEITVHEALVYVMVMISAADGKMPEIELKRIGRLASFLPVFEGFDPERIIPISRDIQEILAGPEGMDIALEIVKDTLPHRLHDTAYSLAVEIDSEESDPASR